MPNDPRPNIILVTTDQQRYDTLGVNGNSIIQTPHLDGLARRGGVFHNAIIQNPVCIPSRACMQTGRYTHQHGVQYMETVIDDTPGLPESELTIMERLQHAGYRTGGFGKIHMMPERGFHDMQVTGGKGGRWTKSAGLPIGLGPLGRDYAAWLEAKRPGAYESIYEQRREPEYKRDKTVIANVLELEEYVDWWIAQSTIEFMRANRERPFFAWCGFCGPHGPIDPPAPYDTMYSPDDVELPPNYAFTENGERRNTTADQDRLARKFMAYYWGLVHLIDDMMGRIVSSLEELELLQNTLIIFTSDHGEMAFDFGRLGKGNFHDPVIRVPFLAVPPGGIDRGHGKPFHHRDLRPGPDHPGLRRRGSAACHERHRPPSSARGCPRRKRGGSVRIHAERPLRRRRVRSHRQIHVRPLDRCSGGPVLRPARGPSGTAESGRRRWISRGNRPASVAFGRSTDSDGSGREPPLIPEGRSPPAWQEIGQEEAHGDSCVPRYGGPREIHMPRPNVVFIIADQHRWDFMGYEANGTTLTPHLDRMGGAGTIFRSAYCNSPLCSPSREAIACGRYGMNSGCFTNLHQLPPNTPTFVSQLRHAGYRTCAVGKTHMEIHAYDSDLCSEDHLALMDSLGWDDVTEVSGNGMLRAGIKCAYSRYLEEHGALDDVIRFYEHWHYFMEKDRKGDPNFLPHAWSLAPGLQETEFVGRTACEWLDRHDGSRPFFLHVGFPGPHSPIEPTESCLQLYRDIEETSPFGGSQRAPWLPEGRRGYRAMITQIDGWVGRISDVLRAKGILNNTIVVYTADHGEMAGDHGRTGKTCFYDASVRVPLVMAGPGIGAQQDTDALVELVDLGKTLCHLCDVPSHELDQGRSLLPLLTGTATALRDSVYVEMGCDRMLFDGRVQAHVGRSRT